ncbi:MAG: NusG domain II-containing protein [Proteobacteria bacterium]|nr:NusG domain II-containing protein [Pseudomonadota bacterium]
MQISKVMRPGDWPFALLALALVVYLGFWSWRQDGATRVRIYQAGKVFAVLDLNAERSLQVAGPLGLTSVEVKSGRVRISSDPSPRQYCVRMGWLDQAGQMAICLPNRISIELLGSRPHEFDSLSY